MNITYDYYRIFYFVAKYQSFTKAASILLSNEPNISRSIRNLEHEFGVSLFIRSNRGVTLTPEGQKLYTRVAAAHHQLSSAEAELADAKSLTSGTITLGVSEAALQILLNSQTNAHDFYLHFFSEHGISIKPDIEVVTTDQILPMIKYDLGIGFLPEQFAMDALMKKEVFQILMSTPLPSRSICLVKNPSQPASIAAREFEKMLRS